MQIRRVRADEWRALRDVRLRALEEAPYAFGTRYEEARGRPERWWIEWTARSSEGDGQAFFLAWDGNDPIGIAGTYLEEDGRRWLISMWTDPAFRAQGVGRALVDTVVALARSAGSAELFLEVTHGNESARLLYERCGFVAMGDGSRPDLATTNMRLEL
jgi:GNAT superfamily N-acetyltransferase